MRLLFAAAGSLLATASLAASPVITENITGSIGGSQTIDTKGYFGPAGADLSGATVAFYVQYVPKLLGPSQECRNHSCTYNVSTQQPDTQGSLLITVSVNSHRVVYSPSYEGAIFFGTQSPYQLTVDSDALSGFGIGLPGVQFATQFKSAPAFGQPLPSPVAKSASNYVSFYDANNQTPVEELTFDVTKASK